MPDPRSSAPSGATAAESLVLRAWALALLGDEAGPSPWLWEAAAGCAPQSWVGFLRLESCGLALQDRLDASGEWSRLSPEAATAVRECALIELRRVLSARAQARVIARLAREHGWTVVVLKGGAAVVGGAMIDLNDVDILVAPERTAEVAAALDALGFEAEGTDVDTMHHLAERYIPNALMIEVHRNIKGGGGLAEFLPTAVPIAQEPPLLELGPADDLRYLLLHATQQHPERIGRVRDLLLIARAIGRCSPEQAEAVAREVEAHERGDVITAVLGLARGLHAREYRVDPFERLALRRYVLYYRTGRLTMRGRLGVKVLQQAMVLVAHPRRAWWSRFHAHRRIPPGSISRFGPLAWIERRAGMVGTVVRHVARDVVFASAAILAILAMAEARWITPPAPGRTPTSAARVS